MGRKITIILLSLITLLFFQSLLLAMPNLPKDPNWLVDEEIAKAVPGWNEGFIKCQIPRGGYNDLTENQVILNSWGYKAKPFEEIKHLLPEAVYDVINHPEIWGTFRINETAWEPVKPRGALWEKYMKQSRKNIGVCFIDENNWLRGYKWGLPFLEIDENDPKVAVKILWNYVKRFQDNDRLVRMDITTINRKGSERHNLMLNSRLLLNGRVRNDSHTDDGLFFPNPKNFEFIYATPYVAPYNLRGTIPLYYRYNDPHRDDDFWVYIPSIRRVRRMSTAQHQDRLPGGLDWTWDNTEGFEGNPVRFNWFYLGRKELLVPVIGHSHSFYNTKGVLNLNDQYYHRRNCYVIKCVYKKPVNMSEMILYIDPLLYACPWSVDKDLKGREWIVQGISQGRDKHWFYTMYNDFALDILRRHGTRAQFAFSGGVGFVVGDLTMDNMKKIYLSR